MPLRSLGDLRIVHGSGDVDACDHPCTRESAMLAILVPYTSAREIRNLFSDKGSVAFRDFGGNDYRLRPFTMEL